MNQTQPQITTTALTTKPKSSSNTAIALRNAWQQEWLSAYNALPVKASMTAAEVCALQTMAPSVSVINHGAADTQAGIDVFMAELVRITRYLGADWDDFQLETCAQALFDDYYHWTFAELKHFTLRVIKSDFKILKDYSRFSPKHVTLCANEHADALMEARTNYAMYHSSKPADEEADKQTVFMSQEEIDAGLAAWQVYRQELLDGIHAARDAEEARQREADRLRDEKMMRFYCEREGLEYEEMMSGVGK